MKTVNHIKLKHQLIRLMAPAILLCSLAGTVQAAAPGFPGNGGAPTNTPLDSWSFYDNTNWTSDYGYAPVSFTNIAFSPLGDFHSLVVDTNVPAWLQYNVYENDGTTNLTVDSGTVTFWFAPSSWSSTNAGGTGPGEYGRLFEVGAYTPDSSYGLWSIYVDDVGQNIYFSAQTNDLSSSLTTYLSAPISWTTNYFHFVALTYSATNTALYLDGVLATNGPGVTVYPGPDVLTNGFYIGSDETGLYQASGLFNTVATYNYPLNSNDVQTIFNWNYTMYEISPLNTAMAMANFSPAPSSPAYTPTFDVISGQGNLQWVGAASSCSYSTNIWITNAVVTMSGTGSNNMTLTFTIEGGADNVPYDVFANSVLTPGSSGVPWTWIGQGYHCNTYTLTNLPNTACFLRLGTPQDTSGYGLTDAYEGLVMQISPQGSQTDSYGVPYAWYAEQGIVPATAGMGAQDPDWDGLLNYQEYQYGTRPQVSEGFAVWTTASSNSSIP
jgi:hypothetical protein